MAYVDIADKQTLDQVKSTADTISTTKIGSTNASASEGTASSGTLMAKNNKIITVLGDSNSTADAGTNNVTTAFGKLKYIVTQVAKIGTSGDNSSTNTLFGRFKKVTDELSTSNTAVGTKNDNADTVASTNNTIFSKLKYVANSAGTLLTNIGTNSSADDTGNNGSTTVFGKLKYLVTTVKSTATNLTSLSASVGDNDTSSSSSTGDSLFSRMKYVTSWLTTARGTKIDNIGATGDTGGSTSAGTVMSKENAILSDTSTLLGRVTTARGTKIDNIGATADSTASSSTGTVMGKLNKLIDEQDKLIKGQDKVVLASEHSTNVAKNYTTVTTCNHKTTSTVICSFKPGQNIVYDGFVFGQNVTTTGFSGYYIVKVFISTLSSASSETTLQNNNVFVSDNLRSNSGVVPIRTTVALSSSTTYYVHVLLIDDGHASYIERSHYDISKVYISGTYVPANAAQHPTIIKSVQRGYGQGYVSISTVNPNKCSVTINDRSYYESSEGVSWSLGPNFLLLMQCATTSGYQPVQYYKLSRAVQWEIIEFY